MIFGVPDAKNATPEWFFKIFIWIKLLFDIVNDFFASSDRKKPYGNPSFSMIKFDESIKISESCQKYII